MPKLEELLKVHASLLEDNPYCYFELAYFKTTGWMAWICTDRWDDNSKRKIIARGSGATPEDACEDAVKSIEYFSVAKQ